MKTLQVGDYVKNLTKEQFDEILTVNSIDRFMFYTTIEDFDFYGAGIVYSEFNRFLHAEKKMCKTELTFKEFLLRAKNTFK